LGFHFSPKGEKMNVGGDTLVIESDENYVRYTKLLAKALAEGRVDGKYRCQVCGMRFRAEAEMQNCCAPVARSA
jgi:hypothetical protein